MRVRKYADATKRIQEFRKRATIVSTQLIVVLCLSSKGKGIQFSQVN